jgi:hypothetical protein
MKNLVRSYQEQGVLQGQGVLPCALDGKILISDPKSVRLFDVWYLEKNYYSVPIRLTWAAFAAVKMLFIILHVDFGVTELYNFNALLEGITTLFLLLSLCLLKSENRSVNNFLVRLNMILYPPVLVWNFSGLLVLIVFFNDAGSEMN